MRVLLIQNAPWVPALGGANKQNRRLLEILAGRGHTCAAVATASREAQERGAAMVESFHLAGVDVDAVADAARLREHADRRIRSFGPDWVLVASEDPAQVLLETACAARPGRVVYVARTTLGLPFGPQGFLPSARRTALLRKTAAVLVVSRYLQGYIRHWAGIESSVLPVHDYGDPPCLGRFDRGFVTLVNPCAVKGISIFLELARRLPEVAFAAVPTWGTTAADRAALEELANVRILPPSEDVETIFAQTRVLLVPSLWGEAFGAIAIEAMLRGIPVLASDVGGLPEAMLGIDYLLPVRPIERYLETLDSLGLPIPEVPAQDVAPWEAPLRALLADRGLYERLSRDSRQAAREHKARQDFAGIDAFLQELTPGEQPDARSEAGALRRKLDQLSPERMELLKRRLFDRQKGGRSAASTSTTTSTTAPIPRQPRSGAENAFPLSSAQQRLWFLYRFDPQSHYYNEHLYARLRGTLRPEALAEGLNGLVRRHELLRTRFVMIEDETKGGGDPVQIVGPPARLPLPALDLRGLPEPRRWPEAVRIAAEESRRPFCLETGPILRCTLLRLDDADHLLVLGVHHIAADHWAIAVALRELSVLYAAAVAGRDPELPELPIQYADFAAWERRWLTGEALARFLAYWRLQLAGAPPVLDLPADRPRPAVQSFRGASAPLALPRSLTGALKTRARAEGVTLYMLLLAAFQTLLHRSTGQEDLVVGTPVAGRTRRECEPLIGYFLNLLPLRGRPAPGLPFRELLGEARRTALEAFARQELPFEQLVESLSPERSLSHAPLFQVLINLQNVPMHAPPLADLELTQVALPTGISKYDIDFYIEELDGALAGFLFYSTDLFDAPTVMCLLRHFESVLAHAAVRPEAPLGAFPLLSEAELAQTLREWNDTDAPLPAPECLPQLFDLQAEKTPGEPAVVCGGLALTYVELAGRANQMARHLRRLGAGPESLVGVLLDRTPDLVVSLLGIAKAGGAYLPLDPAWPAERMALMLEDSGAPLVVTREALRALLPPGEAQVLALDAEAAALAAQSPAPPPGGGPHPDHLAYVLYTSGSTGRPKGVQVTHRAFANFLHAMRERPGLGAGEALLAVTSLSFDIAGLEIFLPLITGGRVVLAGREDARDGQLLQRLLASSGAAAMQATPATWRMLVESGWTGDRRLKALCGGEALPESLAADLHARSGEVWNLYGPTETTVWSAAARLAAARPVSLGRPIANTRIYILDAQGSPAPIGSAGELVIGGTGLARGYLRRPDLTAERFVPDGLGGAPGARLYRTGDLARCRADGRLEHLGRLDHQIKLRGYRIEPGEIEAALARHPGIREAAVVLREGALVAYLVPAGEAPAASELRDLLRANLPEAMIPTAFVALPALPLTPNRKVDRKALPAPAPAEAATAGTAAPPGTPTEEMIAGIWAEVLGREGIGVRASFFDLGGHSLLATRVVSRLRTVFGVELPLRVLFERTSVAELAAAVEEARRDISVKAAPAAPPLVRVSRDGSLPLSFAQERLWFLDRLQPGSSQYNLPVALEVRGPLSLPVFAASLDGIAARHEALRTTFSLAGGGRPVQVIAPVVWLGLPRIDLDGLPEDLRTAEARRLSRDEAARPFDLTRGPLVRATVLRLADDRHTVLFNQHHIVSDGWSIGVLVAELTGLYRALAAGGCPSLPDLPVQYADYAVWQRRWLDGEVLESRLRWWQERLAGAPHVLDLPTDRPRPAVPSLRGARQDYVLPAGLAAALRELSRRQGVTLFMTLASLFGALLSRQSGAEDLLLGAPIAGRDRTETERLIGLFVNTLVLRADMAGDPTFSEVLGRMREMTLGAYARDLPFDKLVDCLQPERSLAHTPLFQVMLALQNAPLGALELPGLTLVTVPVESGTSRFDLLLTAVEAAGGLAGDMEFNRDLFDPVTIARLLGHLRILAEGAVRQPEARLAELPLLSAPEAHQLLLAWNDTAVPRPAGVLLHDLFAARVARAPQAPAVVAAGRSLTYAELDRLTGRLAGRLRALGVGPDVAVGVLMERSAEMVIALLGILRAGGGYLPLDPEYPGERLAGMVEEARVPVLLAQGRLLPVLPAVAARVLLLEDGWDGSAGDDAAPALSGVPETSLAYVLYTSGSTGRPKGVMIPHRGIVNRLLWMQEAYGLTPDDRVLQKTPYSFDVSVWEFFWPLITGACLVVSPPGAHRDPAGLARLIARERVTVTHFVPSMLQVFLDQPGLSGDAGLSGCAGLRLVVASGEALSPELRRRFRERLPARLENLYGPTEASVDVTAWNCAVEARGGAVPIGRPVANTGIHLLDRSLRPVPIGVAGELYIGGVQLARGYWRRPDLTAERFVPDGCGGTAGGRLYRTGDLARHLPDGAVEFLGRIDHQVKIRGFRVELGEIEAALEGHPGVRQVVVVARPERGGAQLAAFFVPAAAGAPEAAELREHLRRSLPEHMVPAAFVALPELPLTTSRKIDRRALMQREIGRTDSGGETAVRAPRRPLEEELAALWREVLGVEQVGLHDNFFDLGGSSLLLGEVQAGLHRSLHLEVPLVELLQHPTIALLAAHLEGGLPEDGLPGDGLPGDAAAEPRTPAAAGTDIAIIGLQGRFPGAPDVERFWRNLREGVESIVPLADEQLRAAGLDPGALWPGFVRAEPLLGGIDRFDAVFFGLTPREAEALDPQQRLFLEDAWSCLERAGYDPARYAGRIGVFAGSGFGTYALHLFANPELSESLDPISLQMSIDKDFLATRVSYKLGLRGPSFSVQTACSTSLVAVHLARQSLLAGECEMALAGGITLKSRQGSGYTYREGAIFSPDGHCRAFDAGARGTVFGSGSGIVLLKHLDAALRDGDTIHAVLKGSAINNDGALKVGFTAPSVDGQAEVVAAALEAAGVSPESITYVEAHGTGTPLGDPVEVTALTQAFRRGTERTGFCALGSVKTNVGHLDAAAGIAGLIKTVLALEHRQIPPSLHFAEPNPQIDFAASPFYVNARLADWTVADGPRRAGVSAFGIGGTNAHVILEEAPLAAPTSPSRELQLLLLSARTPAALEEATRNLADFLDAHPEQDLADVAWTLQAGRQAFEHRRFVVSATIEDAVAALRDPAGLGRVHTRRREPGQRAVAFLFPGQGAQHPDMGRGLYAEEPVFRAEIDACAGRLLPLLGRDLRELLFPPAELRDEAARELRQTRFAQPALFAVELALARLWISWGIRPEAMIGHSLGEYVAACLAGVFSTGDALELVAARGALMQELPPGAMLSVELSGDELAPELAAIPGLALAAINAPSLCVASGPEEAVAALAARLGEKGVQVRPLHTSHAFHSAMMEPVLDAFAERVARAAPQPPAIPFVSNLTGTWITAAQATDPGYWARHLRETVRFSDGISCLLAGSRAALLEVGPGRALGDLARRQADPADRPAPLSSLRRADGTEPDSAALLGALGRLWLAGVEVDWPAYHAGERRRRIPLPTYPFERQRFWVEAPPHRSLAARRSAAADDSRFVTPGGGEDFRGLLRDPRNAEALERLLALEPDLQVRLSRRAPEAGSAAGAGAPAALGAPAAGHRRPALSTVYQAPQTGTELRLAAIWGDLLGIDPVGVHDDFFELGGHSLLATRLLSRLREAFGREIPLATIFAEPTIARLAARLQTEAPGIPERPAIARVPRPGPLPLSFAQQRLWFIDQLEPGSPLYNIAVALRAEGRLRPEVLALTLGEIVRRHEALRTVFQVRDDTPVQVIRPAAPFLLPVVDLSGLPESRREELARELAGEEAGRPFDLTRDPMLRGLLLRQTPEDHIGQLTVHHIASDGWSLGLLVREIAALYAAFAEGRPSPLPELPVQYADFAVWQGAWLQGDILDREISFWRSQLAGLPALLELPTDRPRPAVQSYRGATRPVRLSAELVRQAQAAARREGATLFMVLLAAFQTLLARYSGQQDLAVGSPVAGRNRLEIEDLIGFFVNTLVLRNDLSGHLPGGRAGEPSFRELLGRTRETALAAHLHQDVPFEKLVQELAPERSLAHAPLFQVMFVLQNLALASLEIEHLRLRPVSAAGATARFDLTLAFDEGPGGLHGDLTGTAEYATDLFDAATVDHLMRHYERLLAGLLAEPGRRLGELDLLTTEEALQLRAWNETAAAWSLDRPLHAWIEEQVDRTPLAVAVACEGEELSYRELDRRADRLARRLRSLGVGPEARVAVCLERSAELVVALLAVLKAGGAYVPLDPEYPRERLAFMLADARPAALLSSEPLRDRLPAPEAPVVWLDREAASLETGNGGRLPGAEAGALRLAYVIYTSGSTGVPKGVQVPHRALVNFLLSLRNLLEIGPGDRLLAVTSLSFDIAALELFLPLLTGATVEVVHRETAMDGERLRERLAASRTTFLQATPSTWRMLVRAGWQGAPDLTVLCGGEALPEDLAHDLTARARAVWNLYGPTETTVWSSADRLPAPSKEPLRVTLGRPIANTAIHLLDRHFQPAPPGVPGELYIGGDGVTRGYLRRPDLTAERFLPDPFATDRPGLRLYRTGDLARRRVDGRVEFLGRVDHQVKLRGFRIEPGEIEAALAGLDGVREAVVVAREDRLVAYVVATAAPEALRRSLRERLPDYMVPAAFVALAALPLTPNGKVDRKALPAPELQGSAEGHVEPRTPVEEVLAGIWAELLGLERVGAADHFFELGGHSLLATQAMSRLRAAFGIELPLRALFEAPVLAGLAARIEEVLRAGTGPAAPPLVPVPREGPIPLSYPQERLWFLYLLEPESTAFHLGNAVRLTGALAPGGFAASLAETVRRHEVLRTRYQGWEDGPVQIVDPAAPLPVPLIDLGGLPEAERERELHGLAEREMARPFDLTRDWPLRTHLVRLAPGEHAALFTLHHIAGDGWSLGLLSREVGALYDASARGSAGRPPALPALTVQYADFAVWQRGWLSGERLEEQLAWWQQQLAGPLSVLELPQQRERPQTPGFHGAACPVRVPAGLRRSLEKIGHREGATLFMILLAGFKALLYRYTGQEDLLVGTSVANRDRSEIEGLIGFFVNNLVLRTSLSGDLGFRELVRRVRDVTLGAFMHQEVPFEKVLEAVHPRRHTAFAPLFQAMFVLDNFPVAAQQAGGLEIAPLALQARTANFDLTLRLRDEKGGGLGGVLEYDTDLFAEAAMARMAEHYLALLERAAEDPDRPLSAILLTAAAGIQQLANAFSEDF